jgi:4-amino-4-deoxy-L-arabinose transferase-like glycosyltransferase
MSERCPPLGHPHDNWERSYLGDGQQSNTSSTAQSIRETTKWIVASGLGLLGIISGVAPLSALGLLSLSPAAITTLVVCLLAAGLALGWLLSSALGVLQSTPQTLRETLVLIDERPELEESRQLLDELILNSYFLLRTDFDSIRDLWRVASRRDFTSTLTLEKVESAEERVVNYVDYVLASRRFHRLTRRIKLVLPIFFVAVAAASLALLSISRPSLASLHPPISVSVQASPGSLKTVQAIQGCRQTTLNTADLVAASPDYSEYVVALDKSQSCKGAVMTLSSGNAPFYPLEKQASGG